MRRAVDASGILLPYFWTLPFNTSLYIYLKEQMVKTRKKYRRNWGKFIRGQSSGHSKAHKGDDCFEVSLDDMTAASAFVDQMTFSIVSWFIVLSWVTKLHS